MKKVFAAWLLSLVAATAMAQPHRLWYERPASHWLEALPVGNSHLGAMVYGKTDTEEIALNEETFWSGQPHNNNSPEAQAHLQEVRDSIFAGDASSRGDDLVLFLSRSDIFNPDYRQEGDAR